MKHFLVRIACGAAVLWLPFFQSYAATEAELLTLLQSSADITAKCNACRELRLVATAQAAPVLAGCLNTERLSQAARYALEGMTCPEASQTLREALNHTSGANKAGVIDSLGWKQDTTAVPALINLLVDPDPVIASAAASSLGRIGGQPAIAALEKGRDRAAAQVQPVLLEAVLRCADRLLAAGDAKGANDLYSSLATAGAPEAIRLAAWRGQVLSDSRGGSAQIFTALGGSDRALRLVALKVLREVKSAAALAEGLRRWTALDAETQLALLDASARFGTATQSGGIRRTPNASRKPSLQEPGTVFVAPERARAIDLALESSSPMVRRAAWSLLSELPDSSSKIKVLAEAASQGQPEDRDAAREALTLLRDPKTGAVLKKLCESEAGLRPELLRALAERREAGAETVLLKYAAMAGPCRSAALEGLRKIGALETLKPLLAMAADCATEEEAQPALEAIHAVCQANPGNSMAAESVIQAMKSYNTVQRQRVLPLLAELGTAEALKLAMESARGNDAGLSKAALRMLAQWPDAAPASDLLGLAKSSSDATVQTLALRAVIRVAAHEKNAAQKLALLTEAMSLARTEEKRAALGEIGRVPTAEALSTVLKCLQDPGLVEEAAEAAVAIAEALPPAEATLRPRAVAAVLAASKSPETLKRAKEVETAQAQSRSYIQDWLVSGPYRKNGVVGAKAVFDVAFGPETGQPAEWKALPRGDRARLRALFPRQDNCAAYLKTQIFVPSPTDATLLLGSDDGVKAWLNRRVVHSNNADRHYVADEDRVPIRLKAGTNDLLLKITQGANAWLASARIVGADGARVPGLIVEPQTGAPLPSPRPHAVAQKAPPAPATPAVLPPRDAFKKVRLSAQFYAEGANYADLNRDGKLDIVAGPFWFEGPEFKTRHEYRPAKAFDPVGFSDNFLTYTGDFNGDGWPDILCVPFPGKEGFWYENPKGKDLPWKSRLAFPTIGNESPVWGDVLGTGASQLLLCKAGYLGWIAPDPAHPDEPWVFHAISTQNKRFQKFTHGVGFGDINGDKRNDVVEAAGWWEQPASVGDGQTWTWHPFPFAEKAAQMYVYDVNGDGLPDVITAWQCHQYGLVWWQQVRDPTGKMNWQRHTILSPEPNLSSPEFRVSQMHSMVLADMNGDGILDIVTGKRFWAHGPTGDQEPDAPAVLFWLELRRAGPEGARFVPHLIDDDSGVGTQVAAVDLNGDNTPDIVVANKKGIFLHLSQPRHQISAAMGNGSRN